MAAEKIRQMIKEIKPSLYEEIVKAKITDEQLTANVGPIYQAIDVSTSDNEYTVEIRIDEGELNFEYIANSDQAKRNEKIEMRNKQYILRSFSDDLLLTNLADDVFQKIERREALLAISSIINEENPSRGIYLYGPYGTGKTYMMIATLNRLADRGMTVAQMNVADFLGTAKSSFEIKGDVYLKDTIKKLKEVDALLIDDVGGEVISQWSREEVLYPILNHRMENKKLTFFTSNLSLKDYAETLKISHKDVKFDSISIGRLLERIKTLSKEIFVGGDNHRENWK